MCSNTYADRLARGWSGSWRRYGTWRIARTLPVSGGRIHTLRAHDTRDIVDVYWTARSVGRIRHMFSSAHLRAETRSLPESDSSVRDLSVEEWWHGHVTLTRGNRDERLAMCPCAASLLVALDDPF